MTTTYAYLAPAPGVTQVECAGRISWIWTALGQPMTSGLLTLPLGSTVLWTTFTESVTAHPELFAKGARVMAAGHWLGSPGASLYLTGIRPLTEAEWHHITT